MKLDLSLDLASSATAEDWVKQSRQREIEKQKQEAIEKSRRLQQEEDELVESLTNRLSRGNNSHYTSSDLKGLKVKHTLKAFEDGGEVVLTLADTDLLATDEYGRVVGLNEENVDILENVNISEQERKLQRDKQIKRLKQPLYSGYDDAEFEPGKVGVKQDILSHYDDEEMKRKRQRFEASFILGENGATDVIQSEMGQLSSANSSSHAPISLAFESRQMNAFMTKEEEIKFRKVKKNLKKRNVRSKQQEEEDTENGFKAINRSQTGEENYDLSQILGEGEDDEGMNKEASSQYIPTPVSSETISLRKPRLHAQAVIFEDEDEEFAKALAMSRADANKNRPSDMDDDDEEVDSRDKGARAALILSKQVAISHTTSSTNPDDDIDVDGRKSDGKLVFNSTMEFASRLQAVINDRARTAAEAALKGLEKTSSVLGLGGDSSMVDRVRTSAKNEDDMSVEDGGKSVNKSVSSNVDSAAYSWDDLTDDDEAEQPESEVVDDEQLAFLHKQPLVSKGMAATLELLKSSGELNRTNELAGRAKDSRIIDPSREEGGVKIEYRDEFGRKLTQKEAFRQLSYKFHGYGPSKKKLEKRLKVQVKIMVMIYYILIQITLFCSKKSSSQKHRRFVLVCLKVRQEH